MSTHKTKFTQIEMSQNLYVTGYGNVTDRHPSIICQQIGQTQKWMDITHKKSCNEDTFSTPPFIFEKIKKWRNMEYG